MVKQNAAGLPNLPRQFHLDLKSDPPRGTRIGGHCPQNLVARECGVTQKSFGNVALDAAKKLSPNFGTGDPVPGFVRLHRASPGSDLSTCRRICDRVRDHLVGSEFDARFGAGSNSIERQGARLRFIYSSKTRDPGFWHRVVGVTPVFEHELGAPRCGRDQCSGPNVTEN